MAFVRADYGELDEAETARLISAEAYCGGVIDRPGGNIHLLN